MLAVTACGDIAGPSDTSACSAGLAFSHVPVPLSSVTSVTPIGSLGPPSHTIPTDHVGVYLRGTGITLVAPAAVRVYELKRTRYLTSPFRQGLSDYSISAKLCGSYSLVFGHVIAVADRLSSSFRTSDCETYSTADESVESCFAGVDIEVAAGETLGTVGGASAGAFDLGLYDDDRENYFVNPERYSGLTRTAICPYDPFPPDQRSQWLARLMHGGIPASGESPVCGSMSVDVAGSAQGVWVLQSNPVNQSGDESGFVVLAPHPMYPQSAQTFSIGPAALTGQVGTAFLARYPLTAAGRVNRPFRDVRADGLIYCYAYDVPARNLSYFVRLSGNVLTMQRVTHAPGATPCGTDSSTWSFGAGALSFIR